MLEIGKSPGIISSIANQMMEYPGGIGTTGQRPPCADPLPDRTVVSEIVESLRSVLFPGYFGRIDGGGENQGFHAGALLNSVSRLLEEQIRRALCFACRDQEPHADCSDRAASLTGRFIEQLPETQRTLFEDVVAAYEGDPACTSPDEAILAYPGVYALTLARLAHSLYVLEVPLLPRMITEIAHGGTGIDIHPGASIGRRFFIDHGTGVVIGATCIIGDRVRLYQGVTLGAKSFQLDEEGMPIKGIPRHPIIEDDVTIYAGATILGRITIGRESVIGGNVWLTRSMPPGSRVLQGSARYDAFHSGSGI